MTYNKTLAWILTTLVIGSFGSLSLFWFNQEASAYPAELGSDNFHPGRIIDNHIFTDVSTMTIEDIQDFLEDNVENRECDRYHENSYSTDISGPFTCLFEFQENTETNENNYGLFTDDGAPVDIEDGLTASEIIWQAAQDHEINPQVLLVLLQKEQSLITDDWPWLLQFLRAAGYQCPDDAPCDQASARFHKQISNAAWQFRQYLDHTEDYWYVVGQNRIFYNPDSTCGYEIVDIENKATVALYLYTPYVPNEAALNNILGHGDSCSAYGNRNFWSYFQRWFGPTTSDEPSSNDQEVEVEPNWRFQSTYQGVFNDDSQTTALLSDSNTLNPSQKVYIVADFKNTGNVTWTQESGEEQVLLIPHLENEQDRTWFCHDSWHKDCEQVALMQQVEVEPSQVATFEFWVLAPATNGDFVESFTLLNSANDLEGETISFSFKIIGAGEDTDFSTPLPAPTIIEPTIEDTIEDTSSTTPIIEIASLTPITPATTPEVVLPDNWHELSTIDKIRLNPWGCHDTTQIRADNGRCLSGGYTVPDSQIATNTEPESEPEESSEPDDSDTTQVVATTPEVVLPDNWHELSTIDKIRLNPWGCHDTTQIRADNGRCLSGGYTVPDSQIATNTEPESEPEESSEPDDSDTTQVVATTPEVVLPDNWHELSTIDKIRLNPWGCHDTTQIRADNGRCLSGGYTVPDSQIATNTEPESEPEESSEPDDSDTTQVVATTPEVVLPDNWHELSTIDKIRLNPWGCHDTTQIRADNGRCLSGGYTVPDSQIATNTEPESEPEESSEPDDSDTTQVVATTPEVVLPDNWHELSTIDKIRLNPWGCHDTTQIRADNGRCLSGGYTVPDSQIATNTE